MCTGVMSVCLSLRKRAERKRTRCSDGQNNEQNTKCYWVDVRGFDVRKISIRMGVKAAKTALKV